MPPRILGLAILVALCSLSLLSVWAAAWRLWSVDPLRSIGAIFPLLSLVGVLAVWRRLGWNTRGTPWGLPLILLAIAGAGLFSAPMLLLFFFSERVRILHPGMALFAYGAGAALWFGGVPLFRRALAPLALLLLIDPVPHFFDTLLDLPLQTLSADTARAFAHLIGLQPTGLQLQMMFAPNFGMFIVPGCSGVRGAVTFGYLALIFGYIRGLSPRVLALFTAAAVLLGYAFNLLRLCVLVLFYRAGLSYPSMRPYGTQADYVIGCTLFLVATLGTGFAITFYTHRLGLDEPARSPAPGIAPLGSGTPSLDEQTHGPSITRRAILLAALALAFFLPQARSIASSFRAPLSAADTLAAFPPTVGAWTLARTWQERDAGGSLMFVFGEYIRGTTRERLTFGVYLASEDHFVFLSKLTQGVRPELQGTLDARTATGAPAHFVTSFYRADTLLTEDAESSCREGFCDSRAAGGQQRLGMLRPHLADLFVAPRTRRVPILVRRKWIAGSATPDPVLRAQFESAARDFLGSLDLRPLLAKAQ